ncbi:unnamed protein product [Linum trigynum]|uniref:Uncharacterized protein n=1 Tax=Linum trigynum TaxID=586398 RepID=A0AAV2DX52_9ROSI
MKGEGWVGLSELSTLIRFVHLVFVETKEVPLPVQIPAPLLVSIAIFPSASPSPSSSSPAPVQFAVFVASPKSKSPSSPALFPVAIALRFGRAPAGECPSEVSLPFPGHCCLSSAPTPAALPCTDNCL